MGNPDRRGNLVRVYGAGVGVALGHCRCDHSGAGRAVYFVEAVAGVRINRPEPLNVPEQRPYDGPLDDVPRSRWTWRAVVATLVVFLVVAAASRIVERVFDWGGAPWLHVVWVAVALLTVKVLDERLGLWGSSPGFPSLTEGRLTPGAIEDLVGSREVRDDGLDR